MVEFTGSMSRYPARASFVWYLGLIFLGSLALTHPYCGVEGRAPISFLEALFTSTSAACVTGLNVRVPDRDFSLLGQAVILLLIQLGGIGIMTVTTLITFRLGREASLRHRRVLAETLAADPTTDPRTLLRNVVALTLAFEAVGAALLTLRNLSDMPLAAALWHGVFHSISAFCNAGFALHEDSLVGYQSDLVTNLTITALIIAGGIGYPVMLDIKANWRGPPSRRWERLHLHSKVMIIGTAALLALGMIAILVLEWDNSLRDKSPGTKLLIAWFQSVTPRTAGFNTVDLSTLTNATLFVIMMLMFIGAGPCSTAGGLKVSTLMTLLLRAVRNFQGFRRVNAFGRTVPLEAVGRATTTAMLFTSVIIAGVIPLLLFEGPRLTGVRAQETFLWELFEVVSALCTVGLSAGITSQLTAIGQLVLIVVMFVGRLGPISAFAAISLAERRQSLEYPSEEPLTG